MQSVAPLTASDFLAKVKRPRYKFEIYVDAAWVNLCDLNGVYYLKTIGVNPSGAGATPDVIAGTWSAEIRNPGGIFHPLHPTSAYKDYFRIGRQVRISIGGNIGGADRYYQRLIGYMDAPTFNHGSRSVSLSGCDYSKQLADTALRSPSNHWGALATFDSVASYTSVDPELYDFDDAVDTAGETKTIDASWGYPANVVFEAIDETEGGSLYAAKMSLSSGSSGWVNNPSAAWLTKDKRYIVKFKFYLSGSAALKVELAQTISGTRTILISEWLEGAGFVEKQSNIIALSTANLEVYYYSPDLAGQYIEFDQLSVKACDENWWRYSMPAGCNGPYFVTLNGEPLWQGDAVNDDGSGGGWFYDENTKNFYFDENKSVLVGTSNLLVYYYTTQTVEDVVAEILAAGPNDGGGGSGIYANKAAALAAMDYVATGTTIPRVWFETGTTCLVAVQKICERSNYRFWFAYDGTPTFKPAPVATSPVFTFPSFGNLSALDDKQDLEQIRNRIVIEGVEQGAFSTAKDKKTSRLTGTAYDQPSIDAYLEHTEPIQNHLFQDQASIDAMCATLLAERKDPVWFATISIPNPVPLEVGDTVSWLMTLRIAWGEALADTLYGGDFGESLGDTLYGGDFGESLADTLNGGPFSGAAVEVALTGIIRSISMDDGTQSLVVEITI